MAVVPSSSFLMLVADLSLGSHTQRCGIIFTDIRGFFPAPREGIVSSYSMYTKAANLGFCVGWDLVTSVDHGVTLQQTPKAAATGSHQSRHVRADRDITVNMGLYKPWQAPIRAFFKAEMTSCKKHPSSKGCTCEDVHISLAWDRLEGCFSHRLRVTKRINL